MTPVHPFRRTLIALALACASGSIDCRLGPVAWGGNEDRNRPRRRAAREEGGKKVAWGELVLSGRY